MRIVPVKILLWLGVVSTFIILLFNVGLGYGFQFGMVLRWFVACMFIYAGGWMCGWKYRED